MACCTRSLLALPKPSKDAPASSVHAVFTPSYKLDNVGRRELNRRGRTGNDSVGAKLRKELKVMFEELFRRFPDIQLDGPAVRLRSNFINGIKRLPVSLTGA